MPFRGVISREEWGAVPPQWETAMTAPIGNTAHWEGPGMGEFPHDDCAGRVRTIQNYHMNRGYNDVAYNSIVCPHGYVFAARWIGVMSGANGTDYSNGHSYSHCYLGGIGDEFTQDARDAFDWVFWFFEQYGSGGDRKGHRDWFNTMCPGDDVYAWVHGGAATPSDPGPAPAPSQPVDRMLSRGMTGDDVKVLQSALNYIGVQPPLVVDGDFGPATDAAVRELQAYFGLDADGIVGPATRGLIWVLAVAVAQGGQSQPDPAPAPAPAPVAPLNVDDLLPTVTIRRGSEGPEVAKWQRFLGIADDGDFGPQTDRATRDFQGFFGLDVDGIVGPQTRGWAAELIRNSLK